MGKTAGKRTHLEMTEEPLETGAAETLPKVDHGFESLMKYGDHIENFLAICEDLPGVLKSDLKAVANINERTHCLTTELSREQGELLARAKMQVREATRPEHLVGLIDKDLHEKVKEKRAILYSEMDEKVDITKRMYDILDSAIKTVDRELGLLEKDVEEGYGAVPDYASLVPPPPAAAAKATAGAGSGVSVSEDGTEEKSAVKTVGKTLLETGSGTGNGPDGAREETIGLDEPIYCVCRQIGFGEMIGCDNDDCEHGEWFHYDCVGLPKQDIAFWLCPGCTKDAAEKEEREKLQRRKLASIRREHAINNAVKVAPSVKLPNDDGDSDDDSDDDGDDDEDGDADRNHYDKDIDEGDGSALDHGQAGIGESGSQAAGEEREGGDGEVEG